MSFFLIGALLQQNPTPLGFFDKCQFYRDIIARRLKGPKLVLVLGFFAQSCMPPMLRCNVALLHAIGGRDQGPDLSARQFSLSDHLLLKREDRLQRSRKGLLRAKELCVDASVVLLQLFLAPS